MAIRSGGTRHGGASCGCPCIALNLGGIMPQQRWYTHADDRLYTRKPCITPSPPLQERPDEALVADAGALLEAFPATKAQLPRVRAAYRWVHTK